MLWWWSAPGLHLVNFRVDVTASRVCENQAGTSGGGVHLGPGSATLRTHTTEHGSGGENKYKSSRAETWVRAAGPETTHFERNSARVSGSTIYSSSGDPANSCQEE